MFAPPGFSSVVWYFRPLGENTRIELTQRGVGKVQPAPQTNVSAPGGRLCRPPGAERTYLGGTASRQTSRLRKPYYN